MPAATILAATAGLNQSLLDLIAQSGPMAKGVLLLLFAVSVICWGITAERWRTFRRAEIETISFLDRFRSVGKLSELRDFCESMRFSPVVALFKAGFHELSRGAARSGPRAPGQSGHIDRKTMEGVERMLVRTANAELRSLERALTFLATTASVAPFIGLFGTVWGIMNAFRRIGAAGTANIAAYAPGIAEALVATAAGLAAAIPAVIAYNHFNRRVRVLSTQMDEFSTDFIHLCEQYVP
jgi:biopolymer transport protein TolQ